MRTRIFTIFALLLLCTYSLVSQEASIAKLQVISFCETDSVRFRVFNVGNADLQEKVEYYVIEDEIIARGYIEQLEKGDSLEFVIHPNGTLVTFEIRQAGKSVMVGNRISNCGTPYPQRNWNVKGKFDQKITGKHNNPWAIGVYVGTLGPGISVSRHINNKLSIRVGGTYLSNLPLDKYVPIKGAQATAGIKLGTADIKLDYFISNNPKNKFHLIFGGMYNFSKFTASAIPANESYEIGNSTLSQEDIGSISLEITPNKFNPYLGVGFGRLASFNKRLGFKIEAGGLFTGSPNVILKATGMVEPTADQQEIIKRNLKQYYIYPTINLFMSVKL